MTQRYKLTGSRCCSPGSISGRGPHSFTSEDTRSEVVPYPHLYDYPREYIILGHGGPKESLAFSQLSKPIRESGGQRSSRGSYSFYSPHYRRVNICVENKL